MRKDSIYISNLADQIDSALLSEQSVFGTWRVCPYTAEHIDGSILQAGHNANAPDLKFPLDFKGTFEISFGLFSPWSGIKTVVDVSLDTDKSFSRLTHTKPAPSGTEIPRYVIYEHPWKVATLDCSTLTLKQVRTELSITVNGQSQPVCEQAIIAYIKLKPVSEDAVHGKAKYDACRSSEGAWTEAATCFGNCIGNGE